MVINKFRGDYAFLSNMYSCTVKFQEHEFPSVENAYQAFKWGIGSEQFERCKTISAVEAKRLGRYAKRDDEWFNLNVNLMYTLVYDKFNRNIKLREKLLATKDAELIEGNNWHDNFWGKCHCSSCVNKDGKNMLGKIFMRVREELR